MVTTALKPAVEQFQPQKEAARRHTGEGAGPRLKPVCPKCGDRLFIGYHEPECLQCGWVDYTYQAPVKEQRSILGTATRYVLRYVGEFQSLVDTLAHVEVVRERSRAVYQVACPFCTKRMTQTSLSGRRREVREQRYECGLGHRVSLTHAKGGFPGWK